MTAATTYEPLLSGIVPAGHWQVTAKNEQAAQLMLEERMTKRAFFSLLREWRGQGKKVRANHDPE